MIAAESYDTDPEIRQKIEKLQKDFNSDDDLSNFPTLDTETKDKTGRGKKFDKE